MCTSLKAGELCIGPTSNLRAAASVVMTRAILAGGISSVRGSKSPVSHTTVNSGSEIRMTVGGPQSVSRHSILRANQGRQTGTVRASTNAIVRKVLMVNTAESGTARIVCRAEKDAQTNIGIRTVSPKNAPVRGPAAHVCADVVNR